MSGCTPITTPIFREYLTIKLNISDFLDSEKIVYQMSHELCHCFFYAKLGFIKAPYDSRLESMCTAMSLFSIAKLFPSSIEKHVAYVKDLTNEGYHGGYDLFLGYRSDLSSFASMLSKYRDEKSIDLNKEWKI